MLISAFVWTRFSLEPPQRFMHLLANYLADKFGSLSSLLDVRSVRHSSVVQAGFGILLIGNLKSRSELRLSHHAHDITSKNGMNSAIMERL